MVKVEIKDSKVSNAVTVNHGDIEVVIHFYKQNLNLLAGIYNKNDGSMKNIANIHKNGMVEVMS